jgi:uncharacterized membrane protein HdeD (DUF308 family)
VLLAGIHAVLTGCFQMALALRLRRYKQFKLLLSISALIAMSVGALFLMNQAEPPRLISLWLSGFELAYGVIVIAFARALYAEAQHGQT